MLKFIKTFVLVLFMCVILPFFSGCNNDDETYSVNIVSNSHCTFSVDKESYVEGEQVVISVSYLDPSYEISSFTYETSDGTESRQVSYTFSMPDSDITLEARLVEKEKFSVNNSEFFASKVICSRLKIWQVNIVPIIKIECVNVFNTCKIVRRIQVCSHALCF